MHASNYRYKSSIYQTIKLDKENENVPARRRTGGIPGKGKTNITTPTIVVEESKYQRNYNKAPTQTVWERLSKVKKVPNKSDIPCPRQRQNINGFNNAQDMRKPLLPTGVSSAKRYTNNYRSISPSATREMVFPTEGRTPRKPVALPIVEADVENQAFEYACEVGMVEEILTPRSLSDSKSSRSFSKGDDPQVETLQQDAKVLALSARQHEIDCDNLSTSRTIITNFRDMLRLKQISSPPEEEMNILKAVIKSDERHTDLNKNDSTLFKDILKTQLKSIVHHELVVKNALSMLDCVDEFVVSQLVQTESDYDTPLVSARSTISYEKECQNKLEVDVIFKNVPSLEREISLLRTIGEKLNAALNNNLLPQNLQIEAIVSTPRTSSTFQSSEIIKSNDPVIFQYIMQSAMEIMEHNASITVNIQYIALKVGVVREFRIAQKTIVELKEEANKPFYIPNDTELKRTSFRKLKENPAIFMRYIKPKSASVSFNILDQDPIFFNNIFFNKSLSKQSINIGIQDDGGLTESAESEGIPYFIGDGDACTTIKDASKQLLMEPNGILPSIEIPSKLEKVSSTIKETQILGDGVVSPNSNANGDKKHSNISVQAKRSRRRIRKHVTPVPLDYRERLEPKNHLFKTIFIGAVQISVFIFLIMTFTYPGPKC